MTGFVDELERRTVPAAPRLIATVHEAFFAGTFPTARLTWSWVSSRWAATAPGRARR